MSIAFGTLGLASKNILQPEKNSIHAHAACQPIEGGVGCQAYIDEDGQCCCTGCTPVSTLSALRSEWAVRMTLLIHVVGWLRAHLRQLNGSVREGESARCTSWVSNPRRALQSCEPDISYQVAVGACE